MAEEDLQAEEAYNCLGWILASIHVKESAHKATPSSFIAVFLGILFNTITMTLQITPKWLSEIKQIIKVWLGKDEAMLRELQSLLGKVNFAASMVRAGCIFVSRLINALKEFPEKGRHKISKEIWKDLEWWNQFMEQYDGVSIMLPKNLNTPDEVFSSESCGGYSNGEAFYAVFPDWLTNRKDVHINELELITFIVAVKLWSDNIQNKNVLTYCDNEVSVEVVNTGRARNQFAQACLWELCHVAAEVNAMIELVHISGDLNRISDCLLRWKDIRKREQFKSLTRGKQVRFKGIEEEIFLFTHNW